MALAYFLTFTTYGTWLHGTDKGLGSVDKAHNVHGNPFVETDAARLAAARDAMTQPAYALDAPRREIVRDAIVELAAEKGWRLWAVHVRSNHVHAVVTADRDPGRLMSDLKARESRDLNRAGFDDADRRRWTRHGSTRHLFDEGSVMEAVRYTLDEQGPRMAYFDPNEPHTRSKEPRTK
ncbi:MAG: transposase [Planctomycetaceae bacterium]